MSVEHRTDLALDGLVSMRNQRDQARGDLYDAQSLLLDAFTAFDDLDDTRLDVAGKARVTSMLTAISYYLETRPWAPAPPESAATQAMPY